MPSPFEMNTTPDRRKARYAVDRNRERAHQAATPASSIEEENDRIRQQIAKYEAELNAERERTQPFIDKMAEEDGASFPDERASYYKKSASPFTGDTQGFFSAEAAGGFSEQEHTSPHAFSGRDGDTQTRRNPFQEVTQRNVLRGPTNPLSSTEQAKILADEQAQVSPLRGDTQRMRPVRFTSEQAPAKTEFRTEPSPFDSPMQMDDQATRDQLAAREATPPNPPSEALLKKQRELARLQADSARLEQILAAKTEGFQQMFDASPERAMTNTLGFGERVMYALNRGVFGVRGNIMPHQADQEDLNSKDPAKQKKAYSELGPRQALEDWNKLHKEALALQDAISDLKQQVNQLRVVPPAPTGLAAHDLRLRMENRKNRPLGSGELFDRQERDSYPNPTQQKLDRVDRAFRDAGLSIDDEVNNAGESWRTEIWNKLGEEPNLDFDADAWAQQELARKQQRSPARPAIQRPAQNIPPASAARPQPPRQITRAGTGLGIPKPDRNTMSIEPEAEMTTDTGRRTMSIEPEAAQTTPDWVFEDTNKLPNVFPESQRRTSPSLPKAPDYVPTPVAAPSLRPIDIQSSPFRQPTVDSGPPKMTVPERGRFTRDARDKEREYQAEVARLRFVELPNRARRNEAYVQAGSAFDAIPKAQERNEQVNRLDAFADQFKMFLKESGLENRPIVRARLMNELANYHQRRSQEAMTRYGNSDAKKNEDQIDTETLQGELKILDRVLEFVDGRSNNYYDQLKGLSLPQERTRQLTEIFQDTVGKNVESFLRLLRTQPTSDISILQRRFASLTRMINETQDSLLLSAEQRRNAA